MKIDNTRFSQPTRHHWCGASRDLLLLALSISKKGKESEMKIDNTRFSQPTRHHWCGASRDLLLLALSISKKGKEDFPFLEIPLLYQSCA